MQHSREVLDEFTKQWVNKCAPTEPDTMEHMRIHVHRALRNWKMIDVSTVKKSFLQARSGRYISLPSSAKET